MNERNTLKINKINHLEIGGIDTTELVKQYGTPLYVFDKAHIENICEIYVNSLSNFYGEGTIAYASKSFCCKEIYRIMKAQNMSCDVVSGGELYTALSSGFPAEKIIFHGNNKTDKELLEAIQNGVGLIVVDAYEEVDEINNICNALNKKQNVLIRVNPGVEAHTHHYIQTAKTDSKFGFSLNNGDADNIIKYIIAKDNLNLKGLHCHIGSQIFEEKSFLLAVEKMTDYYKKIKDELNVEFDVLNLGGGFGIWYAEGDKKLNLADYASFIQSISKTLKNAIVKHNIKKPYLILEPGRSVIGEAGITLYTVGTVKNITGVKQYLGVDGGIFENPRFALYQAKYTVAPAEKMLDKAEKIYTIAGKCCESGDIIAEDCMLPKMKKGDILAVFSTGAYNYSMASNYNRNLVPPVVMVKDGKSYYAVKPQSYEDLTRNDV